MRKLGLQYDSPFTGDVKHTRPLPIATLNSVKVHQVHTPFVNFRATFERCSGSTLVRVDCTTVALPCFSCDIESGGSVCAHCDQLWNSGPDANASEGGIFKPKDKVEMAKDKCVFKRQMCVSKHDSYCFWV